MPSNLPIKRTMRVAFKKQDDGIPWTDVGVKAWEFINVSYAPGVNPSRSVRLANSIMIVAAEGRAWQNLDHFLEKTELKSRHKGNERLPNILRQAMALQMTCLCSELAGMTFNIFEYIDYSDRKWIRYKFTNTARMLFADSKQYGELKLNELSSLKSKYSIAICEIGSGITWQASPYVVLSLPELRRLLGVCDKEYPYFSQFRRGILDQAEKEINEQISNFYFSWSAVDPRKKGDRIRLAFFRKDGSGLTCSEDEFPSLSAPIKDDHIPF